MRNKQLLMFNHFVRYAFLTAILLFFSMENMASQGSVQMAKSVKEVSIKMNLSNADLKGCFDEIERQTNYLFNYDKRILKSGVSVTLNKSEAMVSEVLMEISKIAGLKFRQVNNTINVRPLDKNSSIEERPLEVVIDGITVTGKVSSDDEPNGFPGVNVTIKGTTQGTVTDLDGNFTITVPDEQSILVFSSVGYLTEEIAVGSRAVINVRLTSDVKALEEIVVIGYGEQKKESVVGSIVQASGETLMKSGGVSTVGQALSGRLPGVITVMASGRPGAEAPNIYIRGQSSWNNGGQPYVLVDGIERNMNEIDISEIESISVLKDASATAVFGVKGANGVILITTKRGKKGKAKLSISANSTVKTPSKLPYKYDAFDGYKVVNDAIEREVAMKDEGWTDYVPEEVRYRYRNPANQYEMERYPNPDWQNLVIKDFAMDHRVNLSVQGGTDFTKYFGSLSYQRVGDIFDPAKFDNGRTYKTSFHYDRFNYRSNLDFDLTKTTKFSVNLAGHYGIQNGNQGSTALMYSSLYLLPPGLFYPIHEDGTYGDAGNAVWDLTNPVMVMTTKGSTQQHRIEVNSDFTLEQKLDFITEGLKFQASLSYDNNWTGNSAISENDAGGTDNVFKKLYLENGDEQIVTPSGKNQYDFVIVPWTRNSYSINDNETRRRLYYRLQLDYSRTFNSVHNLTALGVFSREKEVRAFKFPGYREDWVGRLTYNYDLRYFIDINGAYNGSQKFGPDYRFDFFPSVGLGWTLSNEPFMQGFTWLDNLKFRGSYGLIGDDRVFGNSDFPYLTTWSSGGSAYMANESVWNARSPYTYYKEGEIGNPNIHWESSIKTNIGLDLAVFNNLVTLEADYFTEERYDIFLQSSQQSYPEHAGAKPAPANLGRVEVKGFEVTLGLNHYINPDWKVWSNLSYARAKDKILDKAEPALKDAHLKEEGFPIDLNKLSINDYMMTSWNDIYMSVPLAEDMTFRRPGYYDMMDFNADGYYDGGKDRAPYGYPNRPQDTWNVTLGTDYKGISFMIQFYGAYNSVKELTTWDFHKQTALYFGHYGDYWTADENPDGKDIVPGWLAGGATDGSRNWFDASYTRLKTLELAYNLPNNVCDYIGVADIKIFFNGNNLYFWSHLPDDREMNNGDAATRGDYPTFKRYNFGVNINF